MNLPEAGVKPPNPPPTPEGMTRPELVELVLICFATYVTWTVADAKPWPLARLVLYGSALLLLQGFIRDLWLLWKQKRSPTPSRTRTARCVCAESTLGLLGIMVGMILLVAVRDPLSVTLTPFYLGALFLLILGLGFVLKDWIIAWPPLRLRKEPDHINIIPKFRS